MADEKNFYKDIIDNLHDGVYFVDRERLITYWNKGAERITGYPAAETVGRSCRDNLLNHVTANGLQLCMNHCPLAAVMEDGREREAEVYLHHADGHRLPVAIRATALRDAEGKIVGAIETFSNNAGMEARAELRELRHAAMTDPLTGLGNRRHLEGRLSAVVAEHRQNASPAGLLFMDVDHFKAINDTYGHNIGDSVLRMVANTVHYALRPATTVGRWGGEEFLAIMHDLTGMSDLQAAAEKVRTLIEYSRLDVGEQGLSVTLSIGGTLLQDEDTSETLVGRADALMYRSKRAGRNCITIE